MSIYQLDARRLMCPMPVIKVQEKIKELAPGDILKVLCTDRGVLYDIPAWCRVHGHEVVSSETLKNEIIIVVKING